MPSYLLAQKAKPVKKKANLIITTPTFEKSETATTENGQKVILKPDKTWEYATENNTLVKSDETKNVLTKVAVPLPTFNLPDVFEALKYTNFEKDKFETNKQYLDRIDLLTSKITLKQTNQKISDLVFIINFKDAVSSTSSYYDSDKAEFIFQRELINHQNFGEYSGHRQFEPYVAPMGCRNSETYFDGDLLVFSNPSLPYGLNFTNGYESVRLFNDRTVTGQFENFNGYNSLRLKMPSEKAKLNFPFLRIAVYVTPLGIYNTSVKDLRGTILGAEKICRI